MKAALAAILLLSSVPVNAESIGDRSNREAYERQRSFDSQSGYAYEHNCFRYEYREEYVPGTSRSPGYVTSHREKIRVPCNNYTTGYRPSYTRTPSVDGNECSEGAILGGILGGGAGAALSQGDGRWWAIPLGIVGGSMIGCDIDGG